jgi:hypothetical protein
MDDQTSLDALLPSPQLPQSMPPMAGVSGSDHIQRTHMVPSFKPSLPNDANDVVQLDIVYLILSCHGAALTVRTA